MSATEPAAAATQRPDEITLSATVLRRVFHNPENGFSVLSVRSDEEPGPITLVGHSVPVSQGDTVIAGGAWFEDPAYGRQFRASFIQPAPPSSLDGMERYLASGMVHGIGPVYAGRLIEAFGDGVFQVIEREPHRLTQVPGIGEARARQIVERWSDDKSVRDILVFLHGHGITAGRAYRIYRTYGARSIDVLTRNPYRIARDIRGIGFQLADSIALSVGIEKSAMQRLRAGLSFALSESRKEGHCGLPSDTLVTRARDLLEVPQDLIEAALRKELESGELREAPAHDKTSIFPRELHEAEESIAADIRRLSRGAPPWSIADLEVAIAGSEREMGIEFALEQRRAVREALSAKITVITGGPGVGKTTILKAVLSVLAVRQVSVALCAPTGRAAKRMSEATGMEAQTIHRLLEFDPVSWEFRRNEEEPLECRFVVLDECSMVDVPLMDALLRAVPDDAALLLVGDVDQLPSVGPGQVLTDIISSQAVPVTRLERIFRQGQASRIVVNAHSINHGRVPELANPRPPAETDFYFVRARTAETALERTVEIVSKRLPRRFGFNPLLDIQVLCPMHRGPVGTRSLNLSLQKALNPASEAASLERAGWTWAPGDKVMQIENDYGKWVFNGDIGYILRIDKEEEIVLVQYEHGRDVAYKFDELRLLVPAWATTIHKSQGSEYPAVVIPLTMQHYVMLQRNLLYTAVTRGKKMVVIVGEERAVQRAVANTSGRRRWTRLRSLL